MTALNTSTRFAIALLAVGMLSACDTLGLSQPGEDVALADGDLGGLGADRGGYITSETPVSSARPVRGFNYDDDD